jgi:hypothetical protein
MQGEVSIDPSIDASIDLSIDFSRSIVKAVHGFLRRSKSAMSVLRHFSGARDASQTVIWLSE